MIAARSLATALVVVALAGDASAQTYPTRPIKIVAPYTPGSPNDVMVRLLGQQLQGRLGQPIVVENKPGGGTTIGSKAVAMAAPDGYTLLFSSSSLIIEPLLHKHVDYDPQKDFAPVAFVATNAWILTVGTHVPANSVKEFVAYAKANPSKLSFGFTQGTASQLVGDLFNRKHGLDIIDAPYKGGTQAVPDVLGGRIHVYWPTPATVIPLIREGKLKALAITSPTRNSELPDVPTFRDLGLDELTLEFWAGLWGPSGLPADVVDKFNGAVNDSLRAPETAETMKKLGFEARLQSVGDFTAFIAREIPRWAEVVKASGAKID